MRSVRSLAALEQVARDYARRGVSVELAQPRRARKRARNMMNEVLGLLISQVSCAATLADSQVRSSVGDDGIVTISSIARGER